MGCHPSNKRREREREMLTQWGATLVIKGERESAHMCHIAHTYVCSVPYLGMRTVCVYRPLFFPILTEPSHTPRVF